ncbi:MAG: heavy-metal-associated domain-containing protein [Bacteroidales bacterium]
MKEFKISGLHCQHCVSRVQNALLKLEGINQVDISQEKEAVSIEADNVPDIDFLNDIIENLGDYKLSETQ